MALSDVLRRSRSRRADARHADLRALVYTAISLGWADLPAVKGYRLSCPGKLDYPAGERRGILTSSGLPALLFNVSTAFSSASAALSASAESAGSS